MMPHRVALEQEWEAPVALGVRGEGPAFPREVLPKALGEYVRTVAGRLECAEDFVGAALLAAAGAAIGTRRVLEVRPGWWEQPALWVALVAIAETDARRAVQAVLEPVLLEQRRRIEGKVAAEMSVSLGGDEARGTAAAGDRLECLLPHVATGSGFAADGLGLWGKKPERLCTSEMSPGGLVRLLGEAPRGLLIVQGDLSGWLGGKETDVHRAGWEGESVCWEADEPRLLRQAFLGVLGVMAAGRPRGAGMRRWPERFLVVHPSRPARGTWVGETRPDEGGHEAWAGTLARLRTLSLGEHGRARVVRLSPEAAGEWKRVHDGLVDETERLPEHLHGSWAALGRYAARLALVLDLLWKEEESEVVEAASVARAGKLTAYFAAQARGADAGMGLDASTWHARGLLRWIEGGRRREFTRREAYQGMPGRFRNGRDVDRAIGVLVDHGYVREKEAVRRAGRGRRAGAAFEVNPNWGPGCAGWAER